MKSVFFIALCLYGCQNQNRFEENFCGNMKQILKGNSVDEISLNLQLPSGQLLKSIQSQTNIDLCTNPILNAKMEFLDENYEFSIVVFKECGFDLDFFTFIKIYIDYNNDVIINNHSVDVEENNLADLIKTLTEKTQNISMTKEVIYLLEWDVGIDIDMLKYRVIQVLEGISNHSKDISKKIFNKSICKLDDKQLEHIDSLFHGVIGLTDFSTNTKVNVPRYPEE